MPAYRDIEKDKHIQRSQLIFGPSAGRMGGTYNQIERPFYLPNELSDYNLHESIRKEKPASGEKTGEMGANIVSVYHVSPAANKVLRTSVTSPALQDLGDAIYEVWDLIAPEKRFRYVDSENLIDFATSEAIPAGLGRMDEKVLSLSLLKSEIPYSTRILYFK